MVSQNYLFTANVKMFDSENNCQILIKRSLKYSTLRIQNGNFKTQSVNFEVT